jgi:hypothetical protein
MERRKMKVKQAKRTASIASHTPGPWTCGRMDELNHGSHYSWVSGPLGCIAHVYPDREPTNDLANARLIAAAPELLNALKLCLHELSRNDFNRLGVSQLAVGLAIEVLKKAEGTGE